MIHIMNETWPIPLKAALTILSVLAIIAPQHSTINITTDNRYFIQTTIDIINLPLNANQQIAQSNL